MAQTTTRARILAAAVTVAARHGIAGASVDEIARVADVAKGSIYYNYASKDSIFAELLKTGFESLNASLIDATEGLQGEAAIYAAARAVLTKLHDNVDLAKVMAAELFRVDRPWSDAIEHSRATVGVTLTELIERNRCEPGAGSGGGIAGAALFWSLMGAGFHWLLFEPDLPIEDVLAQLGALIGLAPPVAS